MENNFFIESALPSTKNCLRKYLLKLIIREIVLQRTKDRLLHNNIKQEIKIDPYSMMI